jgi:hypothetical protein
VTYRGESKTLTPEEVSALVLGKMKRVAEERLGQEVKQAVITGETRWGAFWHDGRFVPACVEYYFAFPAACRGGGNVREAFGVASLACSVRAGWQRLADPPDVFGDLYCLQCQRTLRTRSVQQQGCAPPECPWHRACCRNAPRWPCCAGWLWCSSAAVADRCSRPPPPARLPPVCTARVSCLYLY